MVRDEAPPASHETGDNHLEGQRINGWRLAIIVEDPWLVPQLVHVARLDREVFGALLPILRDRLQEALASLPT
jgi:hypothetical protein